MSSIKRQPKNSKITGSRHLIYEYKKISLTLILVFSSSHFLRNKKKIEMDLQKTFKKQNPTPKPNPNPTLKWRAVLSVWMTSRHIRTAPPPNAVIHSMHRASFATFSIA